MSSSIIKQRIASVRRAIIQRSVPRTPRYTVQPKKSGQPFRRVTIPQLHPAQQAIMAERRRFNVAVCGRRFGKTTMTIAALMPVLERGEPAAFFAPTYRMLSTVWRELRSMLHTAIAEVNVQEKRMLFHNGSVLDFWSLDAFDSVRGRKYACAVIDEAAMVKSLEDAWLQAIRPTLTDYRGSAWFFSTPRGMNYFHMLYEHHYHDSDWMAWQYPTSANPYIDSAEIEAARRELPYLVFQQEYEAQFVELSGTLIRQEMLQRGSAPAGLSLYMGVDLAIATKTTSDYTAYAIVGRDDAGVVYVVAVGRFRAGFHEAMQRIASIADQWNVEAVAVESVQYQAAAVQELVRSTTLNVRAVRPDRDKITRFQRLQARYEQGLVVHCPNVGNEYERELLAFPEGEHDDMVDACVYAFDAAARGEARITLL